ncbi:helix-turn-helix domain-containing protein [Pseudonocardia hispaniensis]|uniref:Helix-turn-helix domain-containing protein n=1 Tax=Pseudonocardia hispaniensis TaxID=904933 RepID=A0ABW1J0Q5_9PSEU
MSVSEVPASLRSWMSAVSEIARAVNAAEPLEAVLTRVARHACRLIGFEFCTVMLADAQRTHLRPAGWCGLSPDYVALVTDGDALLIDPPGPQLDTPAARAFREGRTIAVADVRSARRYGLLRQLAPAQGYRALLAVPLRAPDDLAGVIVAYSVAARQFAGPELELAELLAGQAALALETARLRTAQQEVIGELSRANTALRRGRAVLEWAEQQHHRLMQLVLDEVGLAGLVTALAETLGASVTVEDADGRVLASAPEQGYRPPPDAAARRRGPARAALAAQESATDRRYEVATVPVVPAGGPVLPGAPGVAAAQVAWAAPVVLGGELVARLWVTAPPAAPEPVQLRVVERFALVVALELLQQRHLVDVHGRLSGDLLADLLRPGGPTHPQVLLDRAAALGQDLSRPHLVAVLALDGPVPPSVRLPELVRAAAEPGPRPLAGPYDGLQVVLLPVEPDPGGALRRILTQVEHAIGAAATPTLVAGPVARAVPDYATAFRVARGALALRRASRAGGVVDVRELGLSALLLETGTPEALRRFARGRLRPVAAYEAQRGGDLLATLRTWLSTGCSTAATAAALVVHPNTVSYRLGRIEQLIGRSLRDIGVRLELQLALTIRDIVRSDTGPGARTGR